MIGEKVRPLLSVNYGRKGSLEPHRCAWSPRGLNCCGLTCAVEQLGTIGRASFMDVVKVSLHLHRATPFIGDRTYLHPKIHPVYMDEVCLGLTPFTLLAQR